MDTKKFQSMQAQTRLKPSFERKDLSHDGLERDEAGRITCREILEHNALSRDSFEKTEELEVKGQGTVKMRPIFPYIVLELLTEDLKEGFRVQIHQNEFKLYLLPVSEDSLPLTLVPSDYAKMIPQIEAETEYADEEEEILVSLETHHEKSSYIRIGKGEARLETKELASQPFSKLSREVAKKKKDGASIN